MGSVKALLLFVLVLWVSEPVAEGCSCSAVHLQELFCHSDVVIRVKVIGEKIVTTSSRTYRGEMIEYKVKLIKFSFYFSFGRNVPYRPHLYKDTAMNEMFKGFDKVDSIKYVYTEVDDAMCGVELDTRNKQYLLSGSMQEEGKLEVRLCGIAEPWDNLMLAQKKSLYKYPKGCECTISTCYERHCYPTSTNECVWLPFSRGQTRQGVCMKRANGSCGWVTGKSDVSTLRKARKRGVGKTSGLMQV